MLGLLLVCCNKPSPEISLPKQKAGYQDLLTAYNAGKVYVEARKTDEGTLVLFTDTELLIPSFGVQLNDCRSSAPAAVSVNKEQNMWVINSLLSGIAYQPTLTAEKATLVYGWYDSKTLHLKISNGQQLDFPYDDSGTPRRFTLPVVKLTFSGALDLETYRTGSYVITDPDKAFSDESEISGTMKIRGRGNSTWGMPKKPVKLKLDSEKSVLGMHPEKDWALIANYADKSLLRNTLGMELSRIMGFSWTPSHVPCEVYFNGQYQGVYDFFEHKETGEYKVNINKDTDFYLEIEQNIDEPHSFWTSYGVPIQFKDPDEPGDERIAYVQDYFKRFESALRGTDFADSVKGYAAYIDVDSWVDNYILMELSKNVDGNTRKSSFFTLVQGGKLEFYHVWDFDLCFGNANYFPDGNNGPTGWWIKDYGTNSTKYTGWYYRLFQDKNFVQKVKDRWNELYPQFCTMDKFIDKSAAELGKAPERNFQEWDILNDYVWPNVKVTGSYSGEVAWLKEFYTERLKWLNTNINKL